MRNILLSFSLLLLVTLPIFAQSESGGAALEGRVNDPSGAMVQGASITVREKSTGLERQAQTNAEGQFRLGALRVGTYHIEVSAPGFATGTVDEVELNVGATRTLSLTLALASVATEVNVEAKADVVN